MKKILTICAAVFLFAVCSGCGSEGENALDKKVGREAFRYRSQEFTEPSTKDIPGALPR
jgi:hypothetical protein